MTSRKILTHYSGWLTPAQAAAGMQAAMQNARSLMDDAELLIRTEKWARGAALSILAIEEAGKVPVLREILLARNEEDLKEGWRAYRSHTKKNVLHMWAVMAAGGAKHLDDFSQIYSGASDGPKLLDVVKQIGLYSDACGKCRWAIPDEAVNKDFSRAIFGIASILARKGPFPFETKAELEIWVKHLKPVWKGPMNEMKKALLACYAEAKTKGILQGTTTEAEMADFLFRDPSCHLA